MTGKKKLTGSSFVCSCAVRSAAVSGIVRQQEVKITSDDVTTWGLVRFARCSLLFFDGKVHGFSYC